MVTSGTGRVSIVGVTKRFGSFEALHELSLEIEAGEYCTLLGPSGCGKTTLLRMIAGHETPTSGDIRIDGRSVVGLKSADRGTAMMFQNYALFPHLSVLDNVAFALKMRGEGRKVRAASAAELLEKVGLRAFATRLPGQLSGGQQQRVALARALITNPRVLLLDEPLSALDEFLRIRMRGELRRIQKDLGITFVHVTHNQLEAIGVSDRVVVMDKGRIEQVAPPADIFARPVNTHVARFIGGQNVLDGTCVGSENDCILAEAPDGTHRFRIRGELGPRTGEAVRAAVRKDRVKLRPGRPADAASGNSFEGVVDAVEYQGFYVTVTLSTPFEHEFVATMPDDEFASAAFQIGDTVTAVFAVEETRLLQP